MTAMNRYGCRALIGLFLLSVTTLLQAGEEAMTVVNGISDVNAIVDDKTPQPQLVVVISVDQLRKDRLLGEWPGGLGRLLQEGRNYVDSTLDHGVTTTCPGHAVILSGVQPSRAGIAGNSYVDRQAWEERYCIDDSDNKARVIGGTKNRSPRALKVDTLGDWLKAASPESRVFSVSGKDRAAVMLGGQHPDGVYWFNEDTVTFTTSGYYMAELPDYVRAFNGDSTLAARLPPRWLHPAGDARADDYQGEATKFLRTSGHPLGAGDPDTIGEQIKASPYLDALTIELALQMIEHEQLGQGPATDLLAISLSAVDTVGHLYGPHSAESQATLANIDQLLLNLFDDLDEKVGAGQYLVVLSADHGVADLPEWRETLGESQCPDTTGRIDPLRLAAGLYWNVFWQYTFPYALPDALIKFSNGQVYINEKFISEHELDYGDIEAELRSYLADVDVIKHVWTRDQLYQSQTEEARLLRNSMVADRSGDLFLQIYPDCVARTDGTGTSHGSLYSYDREIPLIFSGFGVTAGTVSGPAHSVDIAPTLANVLGLTPPIALDGRVLSLSTSATSPATDDVVETNDQ
ncbi:MAG: putative AlkP superfamily pyrophosphatase or phosphodiesterase [Urechidicola sp.]|jgi:predicted AlkP superfamily pyrophosphatase or phosphodiesterase